MKLFDPYLHTLVRLLLVFYVLSLIGVPGGKFLERGRVKKSTATSSGRQDFYDDTDFYVGATVEFNRYCFVLISADEYAYNYMEKHHDQVSLT